MRRATVVSRTLILLLIALSVLCVRSTSVYAQEYSATITHVDAPDSALPGQSIKVTVYIDYSFANYVGVWIHIRDRFGFSEYASFYETLGQHGSKTYSFTLTAPSNEILWQLRAEVYYYKDMAWTHDASNWYRDLDIIISRELFLTVRTPYSGIQVKIDNKPYKTEFSGHVVLPTLSGTHTVEVQSIVQIGESVRALFLKWEDGETANPRRITIISSTMITAVYRTQYYLTISSDPPGITGFGGEGWYDADTYATTGSIPSPVAGDSGKRYVFMAWVVDGAVQPGNPVSVIMNAPRIITAKYKTQFYLNVKSQYGNPVGSGWYDVGSSATFSITSPDTAEGIMGFLGGKYIFNGWSGGLNATTASATIVMTAPKTVTAVWVADFIIPTIILTLVAVVAVLPGVLYYMKRTGILRAGALRTGIITLKNVAQLLEAAKKISWGLFRKAGKTVERPPAETLPMVRKPVPVAEKAEAPPSKGVSIRRVATFEEGEAAEKPRPRAKRKLDDRVYDYIVDHGGTISWSQAAKDLGMTVAQLKASTRRLKAAGKLG